MLFAYCGYGTIPTADMSSPAPTSVGALPAASTTCPSHLADAGDDHPVPRYHAAAVWAWGRQDDFLWALGLPQCRHRHLLLARPHLPDLLSVMAGVYMLAAVLQFRH